MRRGVPRLLDLFDRIGLRASFFVPMGKDHTGWTVKRVFTRRGFLSKAQQGRGAGDIRRQDPDEGAAPARRADRQRQRGAAAGDRGKGTRAGHPRSRPRLLARPHKGHGPGAHGKNPGEAVGSYEALLGKKPLSFAAPGWMINAHALAFFEANGFAYTSDTRGDRPVLSADGRKEHSGCSRSPRPCPRSMRWWGWKATTRRAWPATSRTR